MGRTLLGHEPEAEPRGAAASKPHAPCGAPEQPRKALPGVELKIMGVGVMRCRGPNLYVITRRAIAGFKPGDLLRRVGGQDLVVFRRGWCSSQLPPTEPCMLDPDVDCANIYGPMDDRANIGRLLSGREQPFA